MKDGERSGKPPKEVALAARPEASPYMTALRNLGLAKGSHGNRRAHEGKPDGTDRRPLSELPVRNSPSAYPVRSQLLRTMRILASLESYLGRLRCNTCSRCRDGSQTGKTRAQASGNVSFGGLGNSGLRV